MKAGAKVLLFLKTIIFIISNSFIFVPFQRKKRNMLHEKK